MRLERFKPLVKDFIRYYYEDNPAGGYLHVVLEDGNLDEGYIWHCQQECLKHGDTFGYFLATLLREFSREDLECMYTRHWN